MRNDSSQLKKFKLGRFGVQWVASGLVGVMIGLVFAKNAFASSEFLETTGVGLAVGAILGASTLPFYSEPGEHTSNIAIGTALGTITGLGVSTYRAVSGPSREDRLFQVERNKSTVISVATVRSSPSNRFPNSRFYFPLISYSW